jgi:uncharacterized protein (TIGR02271 family)
LKTSEHTARDDIAAESSRAEAHDQTVIPVIEEALQVGKRRVETESGVRIHKKVQEREQLVDQPLTREEVDVERVSVNREIERPVGVRYEGDTMIIPIIEEVLVVEKRLILTEELRVTRRRTEFRAPQRVVLRRELASVERIEKPSLEEPSFEQPQFQASSHTQSSGEQSSADSLLERKRRQQEDLRRGLSPPVNRE